VESEGAIVVPFGPEDGKELANTPLLIRKRDGASLYGTTDLATVEHRVKTWAPAVIVYVTDVRQQLHFKQVFCASRKMGYDLDFRHVWFGMLRFADGSVAATRGKGQAINLVDVLDEAVRRARAVVDARSAQLPDDERAVIAEAVGTAAVRYADLSQNPQSDIIFEWDKMLSLEGNTAPYLMYAHARCCSILRKGGLEGLEPPPILPAHPTERELCVRLVRTPEVILAAAANARPNMLCDHLYEVAGVFARFYHDCPVLAEEDEAVRSSRLGLVVATARTLKTGLGLLGITALDRM
jgi:arginyl-tRNA synthetase